MRVGIFVCDCQGTLAQDLDFDRLVEECGRLPGVVTVKRHSLLCQEEGVALFQKMVQELELDRVVVAGCSPRSSLAAPELRFKRALREVGRDTTALEIANIREQCAWIHPGQKELATGKAVDLVAMAHARVLYNRPRNPASYKIADEALVIGGGPAGMQAALDYARNGIKVTLVEKESHLGGQMARLEMLYQNESWPSSCATSCIMPNIGKLVNLHPNITVLTRTWVKEVKKDGGNFLVTLWQEPQFVNSQKCVECGRCAAICPVEVENDFDMGISRRKAAYKPHPMALPPGYTIDPNSCTRCGACVGACPAQAIDLQAAPQERTLRVGSVVLATGFEELPIPAVKLDFLEEVWDSRIITSLKLERYGFQLQRLPFKPRSVTFVLCCGSREKTGEIDPRCEYGCFPFQPLEGPKAYCSKICCAYTLKQIFLLKRFNPKLEINLIYSHIRANGPMAEEFFRRIKDQPGVNLIRGRVTALSRAAEEETLEVHVEFLEGAAGTGFKLRTDLLVLATALGSRKDIPNLAELFGFKLDMWGLPAINQGPYGDTPGCRVFRPTESTVHRLYVVGAAAGLNSVSPSVAEASAAVARALPYHRQGKVEVLDYYAEVDPQKCSGCGFCAKVCPHGVIQRREDGTYYTSPAFCQGCGLCTTACPTGAIRITNFNEESVEKELAVAFKHVPPDEPRIVGFLCYWCAYSGADMAGVARLSYPVGTRIIRVRCGGSVSPQYVVQAFAHGADGVIVGYCPPYNCHHHDGNVHVARRMAIWEKFLPLMGIDPRRFAFLEIGSMAGGAWVDAVNDMHKRLKEMKSGR
ncbi:methyl-viologen-reducing hydrogenase delta subunit [Ammonifex degensii KC4]|uniref:Methyl-viologen-reducing hydrogenase delta subunit n=1 Tax=Ammonifex degensii (strain DSM 10501 / KC4) TaxID=429009 RepID=C9R896_AMMDK|nr:hydrogenase iron-sulfur subunit [Ammonifex degensii]ACX52525.1 methyl-viologen-reducing hydrogenase delta subunit [Ammonifex degensii KC4]